MTEEECDRAAAIVRATPIPPPRKGVRLQLPAFLMCPDGTGRELDDLTAEKLSRLGEGQPLDPQYVEQLQVIALRRTFTPLQPKIAAVGLGVGLGLLLSMVARVAWAAL